MTMTREKYFSILIYIASKLPTTFTRKQETKQAHPPSAGSQPRPGKPPPTPRRCRRNPNSGETDPPVLMCVCDEKTETKITGNGHRAFLSTMGCVPCNAFYAEYFTPSILRRAFIGLTRATSSVSYVSAAKSVLFQHVPAFLCAPCL